MLKRTDQGYRDTVVTTGAVGGGTMMGMLKTIAVGDWRTKKGGEGEKTGWN